MTFGDEASRIRDLVVEHIFGPGGNQNAPLLKSLTNQNEGKSFN